MFLMVLSTSFSTIYLLAEFWGIFLIHRWFIRKPIHKKTEITFFCVCIFLLIISFVAILVTIADSEIGIRIQAIYENLDIILSSDWVEGSAIGDMSSQARLVSIIQTLIAFSKRPFFGYSLMSMSAHSVFAVYLASVGIYGLLCWYKFYFSICPIRKFTMPCKRVLLLCILLHLLSNLMGGDIRMFYGAMLLLIVICFCFISVPQLKNHFNRNHYDNRS